MHTEVNPEHHPHKPRHLAEKFEGFIGVAMVVALVVLGAILIFGIMQTGASTPSYLQ